MRQRENLATPSATVAFVDIAGFSAISDVYGDAAALVVLEVFEGMVRDALSGYEPPIKWIGDEAMLAFPEPDTAIQVLGTLLQACRKESRLPLTRAGLNHGPVIHRAGDLFGSTINIAARITALASPGQLLATQPIAEAAVTRCWFSRGTEPVFPPRSEPPLSMVF
ncbi:adenylate/guanylate cyclase domain-containing protein [Agrobacterium vitis]|uniref:adenylate/guanylate cyclase domain-containing protein n=1 Tax=Allorhizobium ampelinum TaxID=3025782 RepID=UPI001F2725CC|nr:adenylate/guanylate cyclase domain-containing protein [Allorhizobium ampelinum]MCF1450458.1 adenylate/guanylate cyclase domain-containing protein [Allorhizobium ampelinum]